MTFDLENRKWRLISVTVAESEMDNIFGSLALIMVHIAKKV